MSQANLPDDIRRKAHQIAAHWLAHQLSEDLTSVLGKALLAERVRCADVCRAHPAMVELSPDHVRVARGPDYAEAIMRGAH